MFDYRASVASIHDGDTLRLNVDLGFSLTFQNLDVRVSGFDAPELGRTDHLGEQALHSLEQWCVAHPGPYLLHTHKDRTEKYGRYLLASLAAADGREMVADAVAAGWLKPYSGSGPKPVWP